MRQSCHATNMAAELPEELSMGAIALKVRDLAGMVEFYVNALGFAILSQNEDTVALGVPGERPLVILNYVADAIPRLRQSTGLYHFAVLAPNRKALAETVIRAAGARAKFHGAADHLVSEAVYFADPEGNGIEVYHDRPRSEWPNKDKEPLMDVLPLDVQKLIDEVDEVTPHLPAGTRMGHIHLHVADLTEARQFYVDVLGFELQFRMPGALFVSSGGYHHHLGLNDWAGSNRPADNATGLDYFVVHLPGDADLAGVQGRLIKHGAEANLEGETLMVVDPSGNHLRFVVGA